MFGHVCGQSVSTACPACGHGVGTGRSPRNRGRGATLIGVSTSNCQTTKEAATEIISVALFRRAHEAGLVITRRWVDGELERLRAHPPTCRCNEPCGLSNLVSANKVHWTATLWDRQYRRSKVAARR